MIRSVMVLVLLLASAVAEDSLDRAIAAARQLEYPLFKARGLAECASLQALLGKGDLGATLAEEASAILAAEEDGDLDVQLILDSPDDRDRRSVMIALQQRRLIMADATLVDIKALRPVEQAEALSMAMLMMLRLGKNDRAQALLPDLMQGIAIIHEQAIDPIWLNWESIQVAARMDDHTLRERFLQIFSANYAAVDCMWLEERALMGKPPTKGDMKRIDAAEEINRRFLGITPMQEIWIRAGLAAAHAASGQREQALANRARIPVDPIVDFAQIVAQGYVDLVLLERRARDEGPAAALADLGALMQWWPEVEDQWSAREAGRRLAAAGMAAEAEALLTTRLDPATQVHALIGLAEGLSLRQGR